MCIRDRSHRSLQSCSMSSCCWCGWDETACGDFLEVHAALLMPVENTRSRNSYKGLCWVALSFLTVFHCDLHHPGLNWAKNAQRLNENLGLGQNSLGRQNTRHMWSVTSADCRASFSFSARTYRNVKHFGLDWLSLSKRRNTLLVPVEAYGTAK